VAELDVAERIRFLHGIMNGEKCHPCWWSNLWSFAYISINVSVNFCVLFSDLYL